MLAHDMATADCSRPRVFHGTGALGRGGHHAGLGDRRACPARVGCHGSGYALHVLPAVVVLALGLAITDAPLTATAMNSAPAEHSGIASAVNNDVARFGGLLAVAALPALARITGTAYLYPDALAAGVPHCSADSGRGVCRGRAARRAGHHQPPRGRPAQPVNARRPNASTAASRQLPRVARAVAAAGGARAVRRVGRHDRHRLGRPTRASARA